jgi:hypothetical protein
VGVGEADARGSKEANDPDIRRKPAIVLFPNTRRLGEMGVWGRSPSLDEVEADRVTEELAGVE